MGFGQGFEIDLTRNFRSETERRQEAREPERTVNCCENGNRVKIGDLVRLECCEGDHNANERVLCTLRDEEAQSGVLGRFVDVPSFHER